jgi:DNA-binding MarR family transcriptional regulator
MKAASPIASRPLTTVVPETEVSRVRRAVLQLARRLRQQASAGVTPSQLALLGSLERRGPLTLSELADAEGISAPAVSRTVRFLEEEALVQREAVEDDRRAARIRMTPRAKRILAGIRSQRNAWLAERIGALTPRQAADLERGIAAIELILERRDGAEDAPR